MASELKIQDVSEKIEAVVIGGDLSKLSPTERVNYYKAVCQSVGLNPLTRPFDYITLNRKLTLYARKDATDQLRRNNLISIGKPEIQFEDDWIIVTVAASDQQGRTDSDVGVVKKTDMQGNFGNALMKAVTKAKRRVTLSICGLGMLDETEVETIPNAQVIEAELTAEPAKQEPKPNGNGNDTEAIYQAVVDAKLSENIHSAKNALAMCKTGYATPEIAIEWMTSYRGFRDMGGSVAQAAKQVNEGKTPK